MKYQHILRAVAREPWAIDPVKGQQIVTFLVFAAGGGKHTETELAEKIGSDKARSIRERQGAVAIVPLHGVMSQRIGMLDAMSGGVSSEQVKRQIDAAAADPSIKAILLHVDSPGGAVHGTPELAAAVRSARDSKPIIGQVDSKAFSAAYWVASQANEIVVTPGGDVGSIGVISIHEDISKALEQDGIKETIISSSKYKAEANPFEPLSAEARANIQARVDSAHKDFVAAVASGRGVSVNVVEESYGQGRIVRAQDAISIGMADRVATFDETLDRYARSAPTKDFSRSARAAAAIAAT